MHERERVVAVGRDEHAAHPVGDTAEERVARGARVGLVELDKRLGDDDRRAVLDDDARAEAVALEVREADRHDRHREVVRLEAAERHQRDADLRARQKVRQFHAETLTSTPAANHRARDITNPDRARERALRTTGRPVGFAPSDTPAAKPPRT